MFFLRLCLGTKLVILGLRTRCTLKSNVLRISNQSWDRYRCCRCTGLFILGLYIPVVSPYKYVALIELKVHLMCFLKLVLSCPQVPSSRDLSEEIKACEDECSFGSSLRDSSSVSMPICFLIKEHSKSVIHIQVSRSLFFVMWEFVLLVNFN